MPGAHDDLNVTRYLLVMNTGFALVRDRIRYWDDTDDKRVRAKDPWEKVKNACKRKLANPVIVDEERFFENFQTCNDWVYLQVPKEHLKGRLSGQNVVRSLENAEVKRVEDLKLDAVMRALRNSFAHGGILPMSMSQAGRRHCQPSSFGSILASEKTQIDRVYFVSKWTGDSIQDVRGWIVMEFGLKALEAFWNDWRALLLASGPIALHQLDQAA